MTTSMPTTVEALASTVAAAREARTPLAITGGGSRAGLGRPMQTAAELSTRGLAGITLYEPAEMVIGAKAGTPVAEVEAALAAKGQMLPFEPIDLRGLYGGGGEPTVGGVVATNASGPRRIAAGACRDSLIGTVFVNGRGEVVKSGGRVMKNVTGLDLVKLQAGAMGTLGVLGEVTFKVLPRPARVSTLVWQGLDDAAGVALLCAALGSPFEVSGAAHLPAANGVAPRTCLRLENFDYAIAYRAEKLTRLFAASGRPEMLDDDASIALWRDIRDVAAVLGDAAHDPAMAVWRVSTAPTSGPAVMKRVAAAVPAKGFYDWSGGLLWLAVPAAGDASAAAVRGAVAAEGGHATLMRAAPDLRAAVPVFQPEAPALAALTGKVKASFDPDALINPGRMWAGV